MDFSYMKILVIPDPMPVLTIDLVIGPYQGSSA